MKCITVFLFLHLFFCCGFSQTNTSTRQLKLITVSGSGFERGYEHGQQLKKEIAKLIGLWKKDIQTEFHTPADSVLHQFLIHTDFMPAIKKSTPDILEEVRGIAKGSGQNFNDIFVFQLINEFWVYEDNLRHHSTPPLGSGIGIRATKDKPAYVSQNTDLYNWMDGYQVLMHIKSNETTLEQYILTCPGLIALNGLNEHGIGVCSTTLMQLNASNDGLPVAFMIRGLLTQPKKSAVMGFLKSTKHASGQNYIIGTLDSIFDFEASAGKVIRMYPDATGVIYHTNHPIVNDDIKTAYEEYYKSHLAGNTKDNDSETRYAALKKRITQSTGKDVRFLKETLRSKDDPGHPLSRENSADKNMFTFGSVIFTLKGKFSIQVTAGPPDESEYQVFFFE